MWNIANILSIIRLLSAIPVFILILRSSNNLAIIVSAIAFFTDFFDGYFARKFNSTSETGKILDPIADKVLLGAIGLAMYIVNLLPLWFIFTVILRDILILIGAGIAKKRTKFVLPSNYTGKITFAVMALVITGILIDIQYFDTYGLYISTFLIVLSLFIYIIRLYNFLKK